MGTIDYGTQTLSFDFKAPGKSENFNKINYLLFPTGIYSGGTLSKIDGSTVQVSSLACYFNDSTSEVGTRISTSSAVNKSIAPGTPYIVLRFSWSNVENNYMDILAIAFDDIGVDDLVVGRCIYKGGVLQSDFDYARRSNPVLNDLKDDKDEFKVIPKEPYATTVHVYGGTVSASKGDITLSDQDSPAISDTTSGRIDLVYIDPIDGEIKVEEGEDAASPSAPFYGNKIVLAEIERGASATYVTGDDITNVFNDRKQIADHPWFVNLDNEMLQGNADVYEGDGKLYELSTPLPVSNDGEVPSSVDAEWIEPDDANVKFTNRGVYKFGAYGYMKFSYTWANEMHISIRVKPDFNYDDSENHYIFDSREADSSSDDDVWLYYDATTDKFKCIVQDNGSDYLELISTSAYTTNTGFNDSWHDIVITFSKSGNTGKMYINGTEQTLNTTGNGITNIDLTSNTSLTIGSRYYSAFEQGFEGYITDLLLEQSYSTSYTNYDGTATTNPNISVEKKITGYQTSWEMARNGYFGAREGYFKKLFIDNVQFGNPYSFKSWVNSSFLEDVTLSGGTRTQRVLYCNDFHVTASSTLKCRTLWVEGDFTVDSGVTLTLEEPDPMPYDYLSLDTRNPLIWSSGQGGRNTDQTDCYPGAPGFGGYRTSTSNAFGPGGSGGFGTGGVGDQDGSSAGPNAGGEGNGIVDIADGGDSNGDGGAATCAGGHRSSSSDRDVYAGNGGPLVFVFIRGNFINNGTINCNGQDAYDTASGATGRALGGGGGIIVITAFGNSYTGGTINAKGGDPLSNSESGGAGGGAIAIYAKTSSFGTLSVAGGAKVGTSSVGATGVTETVDISSNPTQILSDLSNADSLLGKLSRFIEGAI